MAYTLTIEDRVGRGVNCIERAVIVEVDKGLKYETTYNPNPETKPFNSDGPFDTSFSIVHPMRIVAKELVRNNKPARYKRSNDHSSVNDAQQALFGNILAQEIREYRINGHTYEVSDVRPKVKEVQIAK